MERFFPGQLECLFNGSEAIVHGLVEMRISNLICGLAHVRNDNLDQGHCPLNLVPGFGLKLDPAV